MSAGTGALPLGARCQVQAGKGSIRFVGSTSFAAGKWVGIELDTPSGKNDGSVAGVRYFDTRGRAPNTGVFVRAQQVRLLHDDDDEGDSLDDDERLDALVQAPAATTAPGLRTSVASPALSRSLSRSQSNSSSNAAGATLPARAPSALSGTRPTSRTALTGSSSNTARRTAATAPLPPRSVTPSTAAGAGRPLSRASVGSSAASTSTSAAAASRRSSIAPVSQPIASGISRIASPTKVTTARTIPARASSPSKLARPSSTTATMADRRTSLVPPPPTSSISPGKSTTTSSARPRVSAAASSSSAGDAPPPARVFSPPPGAARRASSAMSIGPSSMGAATTGAALRRVTTGKGTTTTTTTSGSDAGRESLLSDEQAVFEDNDDDEFDGPASPLSHADEDDEDEQMIAETTIQLERSPEPELPSSSSAPPPPPLPQAAAAAATASRQVAEPKPETSPPTATPAAGSPLKPPPAPQLAPDQQIVQRREWDELHAKLRILEARRADDRERLRETDRLRDEAEEWLRVREKTKSRVADMAGELKDLRKQLRDATAERDVLETKVDELTDQAELSALDKEMAEEKLEATELALAESRDRVAEIEIELSVLKEERAETAASTDLAEDDDPVREHAAFVQLERQNARLKDALVKLRDMSSEAEGSNRRRIQDLEKELELTADIQAMFDSTTDELERAQAQVEDLKGQLDDALGAEDLLEQLTERNLTLTEKMEEMKATVDDLEALKDLSDELEENHLETEKQMQEEIDLRDFQLREARNRVSMLEESIGDYQTSMSQFRELALSLQNEVEDLRGNLASRESEAQSLSSQTQAMLNLNLKLQTSVQKGQVKTIDLELRKIEAQQAQDQLGIVRTYVLPAFYEEGDATSVEAILGFERLAFKADLVSSGLEQTFRPVQDFDATVPEHLLAALETRTKLHRYSTLCRRLAVSLRRGEPDLFLRLGKVHVEMAAVEKRFDSFIDALRKDELREVECGQEVDRFTAQADHIVDNYLDGVSVDLAERERSCLTLVELDLDSAAGAICTTRATLTAALAEGDVGQGLEAESAEADIYAPLRALFDTTQSTKVQSRKLLRRLDELAQEGSALSADHAQAIDTLAYNSSAIAAALLKLSVDVGALITEHRNAKKALVLSSFLRVVQHVAASELGRASSATPLADVQVLIKQLSDDLGTAWTAAGVKENVDRPAYVAPWTKRVEYLKGQAEHNAEAEQKINKLTEEVKDLLRQMRVKEQAHQEDAVKIEVMQKRMESVKKQADAITELEGELVKGKKQEKTYTDAIETMQSELERLEQENRKLKQNAPAAPSTESHKDAPTSQAYGFDSTSESTKLVEVIESLRGAVRFLKQENSLLKGQSMLRDLEELKPIVERPVSKAAPPVETEPVHVGRPRPTLPTMPSDPVVREQALASEARSLKREALMLSATPRLVDLVSARPSGAKRPGWQSMARAPEAQYRSEKERMRALARKFDALRERQASWTRGPPSSSVVGGVGA